MPLGCYGAGPAPKYISMISDDVHGAAPLNFACDLTVIDHNTPVYQRQADVLFYQERSACAAKKHHLRICEFVLQLRRQTQCRFVQHQHAW